MNNSREMSQCPHCRKFVHPDVFSTKTYSGVKKRVRVIIQRCPECKRIIGLDVPLKQVSK